MSHAERILLNRTGVRTLQGLLESLKNLDESFFEIHFEKVKHSYLQEIQRLFNQVNNDYHFVYYLKRQEFEFQLKWKESVLIGHLNVLEPRLNQTAGSVADSTAVA